MRMASNPDRVKEFLDKLAPPPLDYGLFLSYASGDSATATELKEALEK